MFEPNPMSYTDNFNLQPIVSYLSLILRTWTHIMGSESLLEFVDTEAVEELQLRAPGVSQLDEEYITAAIRSGRVFKKLQDMGIREGIVGRMIQIDYVIPSIYTLQQDFKYHRQCNNVVKALLAKESTTFWSAERSAREVFAKEVPVHSQSLFQDRWKLLILYIMRNLVELSQESSLLEDSETKPEPRMHDPRAWHSLAYEAKQLGFNSKVVLEILAQDPDKQSATTFLLTARNPDEFEYDPQEFDLLVTQVANALGQARKREVARTTPQLTVPHPGEPIVRRCGRQFSHAYNRDRTFLTKECFEGVVHRDIDITSLFVRKSVFLAFWGNFSTGLDSDVEHGHTRTPLFDGMGYTANETTIQFDNDTEAAEDIHIDTPHGPSETDAGAEQQNNTGDLPMVEANYFTQAYQGNILLHICSNGTWKQVEVCNRNNIKEKVQFYKQEAEKCGLDFFLFNEKSRGIGLEDCENCKIVGIGRQSDLPVEPGL